jgi:CheY-like chemotaxis protein
MSAPRYRILVVEDDPGVCETMKMLVSSSGYDVACAEDGFSALLQMKTKMPDLVISDLNMPNMSGFEFLSVVRRRFPQVAVIAVSGEYETNSLPGGVIADAFFAKGQHSPGLLLETIYCLLEMSPSRARIHAEQSAPIWIPRNGNSPGGIPYVVVTCTECLRSFPVVVAEELASEVRTAPCVFCSTEVRFILGSAVSVAAVQKKDRETALIRKAVAASASSEVRGARGAQQP